MAKSNGSAKPTEVPLHTMLPRLLDGKGDEHLLQRPVPLMMQVWEAAQASLGPSFTTSAAPLKISKGEKGYTAPYDHELAKTAICNAKKYMSSIVATSLKLDSVHDESTFAQSISWPAISHIYNSVFKGKQVYEMPLPLACTVIGGISIQLGPQLGAATLLPVGNYNLVFAWVCALYIGLQTAASKPHWVRAAKSVIAVMRDPGAGLDYLLVDIAQNVELTNVAKSLELTGVDQADCVTKVKQHMVKTSQGAYGTKVEAPTAEQIKNHLADCGFNSIRLVRCCVKVADGLLAVPGVRRALLGLELAHGKGTLVSSIYRLEALLQAIPPSHRNHIPAMLEHLDYMLWHDAVNLNHASIAYLKGRSQSEAGIFQVLLMRELVSKHLMARFSDAEDSDSSERLLSSEVRVSDGPFGEVRADSGPSGPVHPCPGSLIVV